MNNNRKQGKCLTFGRDLICIFLRTNLNIFKKMGIWNWRQIRGFVIKKIHPPNSTPWLCTRVSFTQIHHHQQICHLKPLSPSLLLTPGHQWPHKFPMTIANSQIWRDDEFSERWSKAAASYLFSPAAAAAHMEEYITVIFCVVFLPRWKIYFVVFGRILVIVVVG